MSNYPLTRTNYIIRSVEEQENINLYKAEDLIDIAKITHMLRIQHDNDNELLLDMASSAIEQAENFTSKFIMPREVEVKINFFSASFFKLNISPVAEIISIETSNYILGEEDFHLEKENIVFNKRINCKEMRIKYIAGYLNLHNVPKYLIQNLIIHTISMYEDPKEMNDLVKLYGSFLKAKI